MIRLIPSHMHNGLARYIVSGRLPGSFLRAVLRGELFEAVGRADDINRERLVDYVIFLHNYAPTGCYGSAEHVSGWVFDGGILGPRLGEAK